MQYYNLILVLDGTSLTGEGLFDFTIASPTKGTFFTSNILLTGDYFRFGIPSWIYESNTANDMTVSLIGASDVSGSIYLKQLYIAKEKETITFLDTTNSVILSMLDDTLDTTQFCLIDRTEVESGISCLYFWEKNTATGDYTDVGYSYDNEPFDTVGVSSPLADFTIQRDTPITYHPLKLTFNIKSSIVSYVDTSSLRVESAVYPSDNTVFIGNILPTVSPTTSSFDIPSSMLNDLDTSNLVDFAMFLVNDTTSTFLIYDSYITGAFGDNTILDTTNETTLYDSTTPILGVSVDTKHYVRVKRGKEYIIDHYTLNDWWSFGDGEVYDYITWNMYEEILNSFGRFFNSPLVFSQQIPYVETYTFSLVSGATASVQEDTSVDTSAIAGGFGFSYDSSGIVYPINIRITPQSLVHSGSVYYPYSEIAANGDISVLFKEHNGTDMLDYTNTGCPITYAPYVYVIVSSRKG